MNKKEIKFAVIAFTFFILAIALPTIYDLNLFLALLIMSPGIVIGIRAWYLILRKPVVR